MAEGRQRWEIGAERVRRSAPAWLNLDLVPWWLWAVTGLAFGFRGAYLLMTAVELGDVVTALGLLLLIAPSQLLVASRRRRGTVFGDDG